MTNTNDFLPDNYKAPVGNYMKLEDGNNKLRILASTITGYEYWNVDKKPIRSEKPFISVPADIKLDEKGKPTRIKHFWAFPVWNYQAEKVQILSITQTRIQSAIRNIIADEDWGSPFSYDIVIKKEGSGFDTTYQVTPKPKKELSSEIHEIFDSLKIDLTKLFASEDPFAV